MVESDSNKVWFKDLDLPVLVEHEVEPEVDERFPLEISDAEKKAGFVVGAMPKPAARTQKGESWHIKAAFIDLGDRDFTAHCCENPAAKRLEPKRSLLVLPIRRRRQRFAPAGV